MAPARALIPSGAPASEPAERAVLAALLFDSMLMPQALEVLTREHFSSTRHRAIWDGYLRCWEAFGNIDILTLREALEDAGKFDEVGGIAYITGLDLDLPDLSRWEHYLDIVEERRVRRAMFEFGHRIIRTAQDGSEDARALLAGEQEAILRIDTERGKESFHAASDMLRRAIDRISAGPGDSHGISTGFPDLDRSLLGFAPKQLIYIAGRPGMGKSVLALQFALHAALDGQRVAFFTLEMGEEEITQRMLSSDSGVQLERIRAGHLHPEEHERLRASAERLDRAQLSVCDEPSLTTQLLAAKAMRRQREHGLDMVVVDYLGLIGASNSYTGQNRNEVATDISRSLKILAKRLDVPVICAAQLNRQLEARSDKRPLLSDLRDSGSLEQDADVVLFVHRPGYYDKDRDGDEDPQAEVIVAKQRNGRTGIVPVVWQGDRVRFMSKEYRYQGAA